MKKIIKHLLSNTEQDILSKIDNWSNEEIKKCLLKNDIMIFLDWTGEDNQYQLVSFFQSRLKSYGSDLELEVENVYKKMEIQFAKGKLERGDAIPFLCKSYKSALKKAGFLIAEIETGGDFYYLFLLPKESLKKIRKQKDEFWNLYEWGAQKPNAYMYEIKCGICEEEQIYVLKFEDGELTEDNCSKCHNPLFDEYGKCLTSMKKSPIVWNG